MNQSMTQTTKADNRALTDYRSPEIVDFGDWGAVTKENEQAAMTRSGKNWSLEADNQTPQY